MSYRYLIRCILQIFTSHVRRTCACTVPLEAAAISFQANNDLTQGIDSEYATIGGKCIGLLESVRSANRESKKNSCPHWGSNPAASAYEANSLSDVLLAQIFIEHLNFDHVLHESTNMIYLYVYHLVYEVKCLTCIH